MKKIRTILLIILCSLLTLGCIFIIQNNIQTQNQPSQMPDDFTFSITWDCYGISSYDSKSGKLVKTTDATNPQDYITTLHLSNDELSTIYEKLTQDINLFNYRNNYDPFSGLISTPTQTIIISVTMNGKSKTVKCEDIAFGSIEDCRNRKAANFIQVKNEIVDIIKNTEEWLSLPDYEFLYD